MARDPMSDEDFRGEVCTWLKANGIDPDQVPSDPGASIGDDGQLTIRRAVTSPLTGAWQLDPANPNRVLTQVLTVRVLVEPSADVAEWLWPKCPTCGR